MIELGEIYEYLFYCLFGMDFGIMVGVYVMECFDGMVFEVIILVFFFDLLDIICSLN